MTKRMKLPIIILAIGLVALVVAYLLTAIIKEPTITEHDFDFSVTYTLNGETKTLEGTYRCEYYGHGEGSSPADRFYYGSFITNDSTVHSSGFTIAQEDNLDLCIVLIFSDYLLMGDAELDDSHVEPYLAIYDEQGIEYDNLDMMSNFDAEIIGWEYPEPVENTFVFSGFSILYYGTMLAMLLVGILVILACVIFVKRDKSVPYTALDIISIVLNNLTVFIAIPIITLLTALFELTVSGDELSYQVLLCVPAISAFSVAVSIALRRLRYIKQGFFIQFVGPAMFVLYMVLESIFYAFM